MVGKKLCIIPTKGNSERFPRKAWAKLGDKNLTFHTLDIVDSLFDKVIFLSESEELLDMVARYKYSNVECMLEPDNAQIGVRKAIGAVSYCLSQIEVNSYESIWMSLITAPFKKKEDFRECFEHLLSEYSPFNYIVSVRKLDFPPSLAMIQDSFGRIRSSCLSEPWERKNTRSQDHRESFRPNGCIYGAKMTSFLSTCNFYSRDSTFGYIMDGDYSDIDHPIDLEWANFLLQREKKII